MQIKRKSNIIYLTERQQVVYELILDKVTRQWDVTICLTPWVFCNTFEVSVIYGLDSRDVKLHAYLDFIRKLLKLNYWIFWLPYLIFGRTHDIPDCYSGIRLKNHTIVFPKGQSLRMGFDVTCLWKQPNPQLENFPWIVICKVSRLPVLHLIRPKHSFAGQEPTSLEEL